MEVYNFCLLFYPVSLNELLHIISANIVLSLGKLLRKSPTVPFVLIKELDELLSASLVHVPFSYKTACPGWSYDPKCIKEYVVITITKTRFTDRLIY
jgi:hypothetical protein